MTEFAQNYPTAILAIAGFLFTSLSTGVVSLSIWAYRNLRTRVEEVEVANDDIKTNYIQRFMDVTTEIHKLELKIMKQFEDLKSIMLNSNQAIKDDLMEEISPLKTKLEKLEAEHNLIHRQQLNDLKG